MRVKHGKKVKPQISEVGVRSVCRIALNLILELKDIFFDESMQET